MSLLEGLSKLTNTFSPEPAQEEKTSWTTCIATAATIAGMVYFADRQGYIKYQDKNLATLIGEHTPQIVKDRFSDLRIFGNEKYVEISERGFQNVASDFLNLAQGYGNSALQNVQIYGNGILNSIALKFDIPWKK